MSKGQSKYRNQVPNWISFEIEIDRLHGTGKIIPNRSKSRVGNAWLCLIALMAKCYVIFHASRIMNNYMNNYMNNHTLPPTYSDILQTCSNFPYFSIFFGPRIMDGPLLRIQLSDKPNRASHEVMMSPDLVLGHRHFGPSWERNGPRKTMKNTSRCWS